MTVFISNESSFNVLPKIVPTIENALFQKLDQNEIFSKLGTKLLQVI